MKRNFFLLPFLLTSYIFSSSFLFKPNIKAVICGETEHLENINSKSEREKFKRNQTLNFDYRTGQLYIYDNVENALKPWIETLAPPQYRYVRSYIKKGTLYIIGGEGRYLDPEKTIDIEFYLDLKKLKISYLYPEVGEEFCKEIKLPKGIKILE